MDIFLARQAIYNKSKDVVGYELLYRSSDSNSFSSSVDAESATYEVIKNITCIGLELLTNNKIAFINCNEDVLNNDAITLLSKSDIVIEILETVDPTEEVINRVRYLYDEGYVLAVDDIVDLYKVNEFLPYIKYAKIDFLDTTKKTRSILVNSFKKRGITLLAEKIETYEEFCEAIDLGFDLFQGYYFSRPNIIKSKDIVIKSRVIFILLQELAKEEFDIDNIENIMKADIALMYKFMRFINSAYFGFLQEISEIKRAIMLVGKEQLRKWLFIVSLADLYKDTNKEYTNLTIVRARFCESIVAKINLRKKSEGFIVGIFSDIHLIMHDDIYNVLKELPINKDLKDALLGHKNFYRTVLELSLAYENMDIDKIKKLCDELNINSEILKDLYLEAIEWTSKINCY